MLSVRSGSLVVGCKTKLSYTIHKRQRIPLGLIFFNFEIVVLFLFFPFRKWMQFHENTCQNQINMREPPGQMGFSIRQSCLTRFINVREYRRAIKKGQSRETGKIGYTRGRKAKQKHNTICVGHHYTQTNTNHTELRR
jgi:hypothetical protein